MGNQSRSTLLPTSLAVAQSPCITISWEMRAHTRARACKIIHAVSGRFCALQLCLWHRDYLCSMVDVMQHICPLQPWIVGSHRGLQCLAAS